MSGMIGPRSVIFPTILGLIVVVIVCIKRKTKLSRMLLFLVLTAYVGAVISVALFPIPINAHFPSLSVRYNIIPFNSILSDMSHAQRPGFWWVYMRGVVGNILMFVPLGFMLPLLSEKQKKPIRVIVTVLICSASIELAQLVAGFCLGDFYRVVDIDDIILNTLGGVLGYLAFLLWSRVTKDLPRK